MKSGGTGAGGKAGGGAGDSEVVDFRCRAALAFVYIPPGRDPTCDPSAFRMVGRHIHHALHSH